MSAARFLAALLGSVLLAGGCTSMSVYAPEHLCNEPDETVTVLLADGRSIRFYGGDYTLRDSAGVFLTGKGELLSGKVDNSFTYWEGTIPLYNITSVSTTQVNLFGIVGFTTVGLVLLGSVILFMLVGAHVGKT
jgi:hypothetical protein